MVITALRYKVPLLKKRLLKKNIANAMAGLTATNGNSYLNTGVVYWSCR